MRIVWFKRDLRTTDHAPLAAAAASGDPVLPLYIVEPDLWRQPELSARQFGFLAECLDDLDADLERCGARLTLRVGEAVDVLAKLHRAQGLTAIHAHEETGLYWTYDRDKAVKRWAKRAGVPFIEHRQSGVIRALKNRRGWAGRWDRQMAEPLTPAPLAIRCADLRSGARPDAAGLGLARDLCPERQTGGRRTGLALLNTFLDHRGRDYRREMSSPVTAYDACSRLSPHLAFGTVSMRECAQAAISALNAKRAAGDTVYSGSVNSFIGRLHWHCHFMQKLEDEPDLERRNLHRAYDGLRTDPAPEDPNFIAWKTGRTGLPFVDACMRALDATGWLNFRMRAMVMAVSSYHLWTHWRAPAQFLARQFTDFEAGIHYPQSQMQSGTTGINTVRIYNPVKQSQDQDPHGRFIRHWVPELRGAPDSFIHEPWRMPEDLQRDVGCVIGRTYPARVVDHLAAARFAREQIYGARRGAGYRETANAIQDKHGSRKSGIKNRGQRPAGGRRSKTPPAQTELDLSPPTRNDG